jgi:putative endonuclease
MDRSYAVYIMANENNSVLYTGVTNDLTRRVAEHRTGAMPGFTKRYNVKKLVYYEFFGSIELAIGREKQLKRGSRRKKDLFVAGFNPSWTDLYDRVAH